MLVHVLLPALQVAILYQMACFTSTPLTCQIACFTSTPLTICRPTWSRKVFYLILLYLCVIKYLSMPYIFISREPVRRVFLLENLHIDLFIRKGKTHIAEVNNGIHYQSPYIISFNHPCVYRIELSNPRFLTSFTDYSKTTRVRMFYTAYTGVVETNNTLWWPLDEADQTQWGK